MISLKPLSPCDMVTRLPWQRAVLGCLLMPASLCSPVKTSLGDFHVVWASAGEHGIPLWPIIPHEERGDASTYFYYKAFTSLLPLTGMLLCPPAPSTLALSALPCPHKCQPLGTARCFNLFPPSPVLALRHQPRSCPTLSAPTELWPLPTTLPPHILHLTLDFYIKGVHLLEQHSLKKSNESQTDNFIRVISSKLKLLPITKSSLNL